MKSPPFTSLEDNFVTALEKLETAEERATLAKLRRGLGKPLGFATERDGWVLRHAPEITESEHQRKLGWFAAVASLFATHPQSGGKGSFGEALRSLSQRSPAPDGGPNANVEKRFVALLNSNSEDLPDRLRHAVSLLKTATIAIDWRCLLHDLVRWDSQWRTVQKEWSREFWGSRRPTESAAVAETSSEATAASV